LVYAAAARRRGGVKELPVGLIKEFKEFAVKGNVIDLAVGIIIGAAFGKIVSSLVNDVIMPPIGLALGQIDFSKLAVHLAEGKDGKTVDLRYGVFLNTMIEFLIVAFAVFMLVKAINTLRRRMETQPAPADQAPPAPTREEKLLMEIRDALLVRR
jgi:large conductance mechanosensitive channel